MEFTGYWRARLEYPFCYRCPACGKASLYDLQSDADQLACSFCGSIAVRVAWVAASDDPEDGVIPDITGTAHFPRIVDSLIELLGALSRLQASEDTTFEFSPPLKFEDLPQLSVLVLFATLNEVLCEHLLPIMMTKLGVPEDLREYTLKREWSISRRKSDLFRALAGRTWSDCVDEIGRRSSRPYRELDSFVTMVIQLRNDLVHKAVLSEHVIGQVARDTLDRSADLLEMYVAFWNWWLESRAA